MKISYHDVQEVDIKTEVLSKSSDGKPVTLTTDITIRSDRYGLMEITLFSDYKEPSITLNGKELTNG